MINGIRAATLFLLVTVGSVDADDGRAVNRWITVHSDVVYGQDAPELQRLDAYLVRSKKPTPVLIEIHGGGFRSGKKSAGANRTARFFDQNGVYMRALRAGISVISIDYRLAPKYPFPAQGEDVARAVQFVRSKAATWNLDPARVALCGRSAGGHLSAWVGFHDDLARPGASDPVARESTRVSAVVNIAGPIDFARFDPVALQETRKGLARTLTNFIGCDASSYNKTPQTQAKIRAASPIHLVTPDDPPTMLVYQHRGGRPTGPVPDVIESPHSAWFGVLMARELARRGVPHEALIAVRRSRSEQAQAIVAFLTKHLGIETAQQVPLAATQNLVKP